MATKISVKPTFADEEVAHAAWASALDARLRAERMPCTAPARLRHLIEHERKTLAYAHAVGSARFAFIPAVIGTPSEAAVEAAKAVWLAAVTAHAHAQNTHALPDHTELLLLKRDAALAHYTAVTAARRTGLVRDRERAAREHQQAELRKVTNIVAFKKNRTSPAALIAAVRKPPVPARPAPVGRFFRGVIAPEGQRPVQPTQPTSLDRFRSDNRSARGLAS